MTQAQLVERFIAALHTNPHAEVPPGLDSALAETIRRTVLAERASSAPLDARARVWDRVLRAVDADAAPATAAGPRPSTNGHQADNHRQGFGHKEHRDMTTIAQRQTRSMPLHAGRLMALAAMLAVVIFGGLLLSEIRGNQATPSGPAMVIIAPEEVHIAVFERYIHAVWNAGGVAVLEQMVTDDVVRHEPGLPDIAGIDDLGAFITAFRAAYPDAQFTITSLNAEGEQVFARLAFSGTQSAPLILPDGTAIGVGEMAVADAIMVRVRFDDGHVAELWLQGDAAGTITVGEGCTLVDAVNAANTNEAVGNCRAGRMGQRDVIELTADVVLAEADNRTDGPNGLPSITSQIVIQGNGFTIARAVDAERFRVFHVAELGRLTLDHVTVRDTLGQSGGVVLNLGMLIVRHSAFVDNKALMEGGVINNQLAGVVLIIDSTFSGNTASSGGAIFNNGVLTVHNSTFTGNTASGGGGAIISDHSAAVLITGSTFEDNTANEGGAILTYSTGEFMLIDSVLANNTARNGGGIYNRGTYMEIVRTTITGNMANNPDLGYLTGGGAGIINWQNATMVIIDSTIADNHTANGTGGGIYNEDGSTMIISGSAIYDNSGMIGAGVMSFNDSTLTITNSTICGNAATDIGGGILHGSGVLTVVNSTVCNNTANLTGGITNGFLIDGFPGTGGGEVTLTNTIVADNANGDCVALDDTGVFVGAHNLDTDGTCPGSAIIEGLDTALDEHGGLTMTVSLLDGSNAIDAGDPNVCPAVDQRGAERVDVCDIGAFEFGGVVAED